MWTSAECSESALERSAWLCRAVPEMVRMVAIPGVESFAGLTAQAVAQWSDQILKERLACVHLGLAQTPRAVSGAWLGRSSPTDSTRQKLHALGRIKTIAVSVDESRLHAADLRIPGREVGEKEQPASL